MSWTTVPFKNPGDPVSAENWNGLVGNLAAIADGEAGAPRIALPGAVVTSETDPLAILHADGAGGVRWNRLSLEYRTGSTRLTNVHQGVWIVHGLAYIAPQSRDDAAERYTGMAILVNGSIAYQFALRENSSPSTIFSMAGHDLTITSDMFPRTQNFGMIGVRVG